MPLRFGNPIKLVLKLSVCGIGETFEKDSERVCWLFSRKEALGEDDKKNTESFLADKNGNISLK